MIENVEIPGAKTDSNKQTCGENVLVESVVVVVVTAAIVIVCNDGVAVAAVLCRYWYYIQLLPGDVVPPGQDLFYNFLDCMALVSIHQVIQPRIECQTWLIKVATMSQKLEDLWVLKSFADKLVINMRGCPCIMNKIDPPCIRISSTAI
ncbi:hypothetical protein FRACYDRAFT_256875 [Fragilariopsis cylindrus CCMP1102]|uniref:Uncharacterized protein n=1 Tax=Fragilariopsis cylindrus CCMP1102 TaxID=635003 RepID=A0A1E7EJD8_9STRA|nr:hypothetical protein FRACYDRAFT_256875 [Fragilariopsis cylindrus CCMP1102]|eukprot:OEU06018.1 hypothetical protein FRACYDRAFT_256875 [Fragilariopsis cylindrus CCMP1102]